MKTCWRCSSKIPVTAEVCPYCTRDISGAVAAVVVGGSNVFLFLLIVGALCMNMLRDCVGK
jgi:hypothetical protein